jgi:hypothetical protein
MEGFCTWQYCSKLPAATVPSCSVDCQRGEAASLHFGNQGVLMCMHPCLCMPAQPSAQARLCRCRACLSVCGDVMPCTVGVCAGAHPSTQRAALALVVNHLGPDAAAAISHAAPAPSAAAGGSGASSAAARTSQAGAPAPAAGVDAMWSSEKLLQDRAEAAADKLLRTLS